MALGHAHGTRQAFGRVAASGGLRVVAVQGPPQSRHDCTAVASPFDTAGQVCWLDVVRAWADCPRHRSADCRQAFCHLANFTHVRHHAAPAFDLRLVLPPVFDRHPLAQLGAWADSCHLDLPTGNPAQASGQGQAGSMVTGWRDRWLDAESGSVILSK